MAFESIDGVKKILSWVTDIEDGALNQAQNLAALPFVFKHVALMPDCHQGYGMPIGGVMACKDVIAPNAVGVDIGCGMCAIQTSLQDIDIDTLKAIMGRIREVVPVGFKHHKEPQNEELMPKHNQLAQCRGTIIRQQYQSALYQLGTLGGGNHFIEIQKGNDGHIWIMIHSGSRNLGLKVAKHYNKIAVDLNTRYYSVVQKEHELAFLPMDSDEGKRYLAEMNYCVDFAYANRHLMMRNILDCFLEVIPSMQYDELINIAHNYARLEHHFGHNVVVHRKGATHAGIGVTGIIPGSQGTKSYIVEGLGNPLSFQSCSHGAGRRMGRKQAQRELSLEDEQRKLNEQGIIHSVRHKKDLDEAAGAYKDIEGVMRNQADLVEIKVELSPLAVIKG